MNRMIVYRGFEIHVELTLATQDTFDVTLQIKGGPNLKELAHEEAPSRCAMAPLPNAGPTW